MRHHPIAIVLGTRPEIIKLAPIVRLLGRNAKLIHTGQHFDVQLSEVFFTAFGLGLPATTLGIGGASRGRQIGLATAELDRLFSEDRPAAVVVQGDTNSTVAAALAANANGIPLAHVEAGLRSFDRAMPEEHNRVLTDHLADLCLAPTAMAAANLRAEAIPDDRVNVTGNTIVEAVEYLLPDPDSRARTLERFGVESERFVVSTLHRPENVDDPEQLKSVLRELAGVDLPVVLSLHPRTRGQIERHRLGEFLRGLNVVEPVGYAEFLGLLAESALVISDSGGLQEEVSVLKKPMVVVRRSTERPEVLGTFCSLAIGPEIGDAVAKLLKDLENTLEGLRSIPTPYGDGRASERSVAAIEEIAGG